ncbi:MAG: hypothetical protein AAF327_10090 [Cyanobacteria bacterium P01_A01_bin.37]
MIIPEPHYPRIAVSFNYRGCRIQIERDLFQGNPIYAAWVDHATGSALADSFAFTREEAVRQAKRWVDEHVV